MATADVQKANHRKSFEPGRRDDFIVIAHIRMAMMPSKPIPSKTVVAVAYGSEKGDPDNGNLTPQGVSLIPLEPPPYPPPPPP
ncbi:MAG: hypothetical protein Q9170_008280, partial [Blastenia crenularia]